MVDRVGNSVYYKGVVNQNNNIMNIEFTSSSMLQSPVIVDTDAGTATLTYKNSGKDYTYQIDNNFVQDLQETITNEKSVGKFILAARADRRLTEVTV